MPEGGIVDAFHSLGGLPPTPKRAAFTLSHLAHLDRKAPGRLRNVIRLGRRPADMQASGVEVGLKSIDRPHFERLLSAQRGAQKKYRIGIGRFSFYATHVT
jgi:hypothetical protein